MTKAEIRRVRSLADKKGRAAEGLFVAEGVKTCREILASELECTVLYLAGTLAGPAGREAVFGRDLLERAHAVETVSGEEMDRISHLKTPSEALALVRLPVCDAGTEVLRGELSLALDNVQDPGNVGTIVRLADWFGIRRLFCSPGTADCFSPKTVQATMGSIARVKVFYTDLAALLERAGKEGAVRYGTFLDGRNIYREALSPEGIIVMGNEGRGISPAVGRHVDRRLCIPPWSPDERAESLNVGIATAIVCSEFRRGRMG